MDFEPLCSQAYQVHNLIRLAQSSIWNRHLHHNVLIQLVNLTKLFKLLQNTTGKELYPAEQHYNL